jgi:hypothetical protein
MPEADEYDFFVVGQREDRRFVVVRLRDYKIYSTPTTAANDYPARINVVCLNACLGFETFVLINSFTEKEPRFWLRFSQAL